MLMSINGKICNPDDAKISVLDRGFLYGDSIYEVTYSQNRCLIFFDEHLQRLENSARLIRMPLDISKEQIVEQSLKLLKQYNHNDAYIRIVITRGVGEISLDPNMSTKNNVIMIAKPKPIYPESFYDEGISLFLSSYTRNEKSATDPNAKSGNYLNNIMAIEEAKRHGMLDAIMINKEGELTEGTTFNIWLVKNNDVLTPHHQSGILKGITRDKVLKLKGHKVQEKTLYTKDILEADECFITSSTKGIMPVRLLKTTDGQDKLFKSFAITNSLASSYNKAICNHLSLKKYTY